MFTMVTMELKGKCIPRYSRVQLVKEGETYADLALLLKVQKRTLEGPWVEETIRNINQFIEDKNLNEICQYGTMKKEKVEVKDNLT